MYEDGAPAVLAERLVKRFTGREGEVEAVRGVDLEVRAGEVFGFLGPNGAGKSTTVRWSCTAGCSASAPPGPRSARRSC